MKRTKQAVEVLEWSESFSRLHSISQANGERDKPFEVLKLSASESDLFDLT